MKPVLTSKGQVTLPVTLRRKLGLKKGDVLEFDETVPYLKAHRLFDQDIMRKAVGRGKNRSPQRTSSEWLDELRGPVELP